MEKLLESGKLLLGVNYWSSRDAINMWSNWDADVVERDFAQMASCGITHLRVFPLWSVFQPIHAMRSNFATVEYGFANDQPLPDTEAGRAGVSEEACEHFATLCELAERYGLKLIVGLITGHMSFRYYAPPALEGKSPITDPTLIRWELRFVSYFVRRFASYPAIAGWDLGNECNGFLPKDSGRELTDAAYVWCATITNAIRTADPNHPVISGFDVIPVTQLPFHIGDVAELVDIHTVHPYNVFLNKKDPLTSMRPILESTSLCRTYSGVGKLPVFVQEIGSIGYTLCSERSESLFYRALLFSSWAYDCLGVMWWCAYDQNEMSYAPYDWNTIGSAYGFFRADRSQKPIAAECKRFAKLMESLPIKALPPVQIDALCILPNNEPRPRKLASTAFLLAVKANLNLGYVQASQPIPKAPIYLMPSVDPRHSIAKRRLEEVLSHVREGSVLYLSIGEGLMRDLPSLTGVEIFSREGNCAPERITLGEHTLTAKSDYRYSVGQVDAEALAYGEDGRPVYFRHKFGKGWVYFSTVPIEKYLAEQTAWLLEDRADYSQWYRIFSGAVADAHVADVASSSLRITEHCETDGTRYAIAINYSHRPIEAELLLKGGWSVSDVLYGAMRDGRLVADACDAVILKLTEEK